MIDASFAQAASAAHQFDALLAGDTDDLVSRKVTLTGGAALARGAVLGYVTALAAALVASPAAGNAGNGAIGALSVRADAIPGAYRAVCVAAAANGGTFAVYGPTGASHGTVAVGAAFTGPVGFTISGGAVDFAVGDDFVIVVPTASVAKLSAAAANDGSAVPMAVLAHDADASAGDVEVLVYEAGLFNAGALAFGAGHTADTVAEPLRRRGIFLAAGLPA